MVLQWFKNYNAKVKMAKMEVKVAKETGTLSLQQIKRQDMLKEDFLMMKSK